MVFFGYDALGRLTSESRVSSVDDRRFTTQQSLTPSGQVLELSFGLPSVEGFDSVIYDYDSARRMQSVALEDASVLFDAAEIDEFGRYQEVLLGNGVVESYHYRPDRRRELLSQTITTTNEVVTTAYLHYDGEGRLTHRRIGYQPSSTLGESYTRLMRTMLRSNWRPR
jgi:hypothetical protein